MSINHKRVAVIVPAFNEEQGIALVVTDFMAARHNAETLIDDIIVCDNNSTDDTAKLAKKAGARVVFEPQAGYGAACLKGIKSLRADGRDLPDYVVFADGDYSAHANQVNSLLKTLEEGADLVIGSRENTGLSAGAIGWHQRLGNRMDTTLINLLWRQKVSDLGPFRAIKYSCLLELDMQDQTFGWTVEMQVKAIQAGFDCREVPVSTRRRKGVSKISGTVRGTIGAGIGIFSKIFQLYANEKEFVESVHSLDQSFKTR